MALWECAECTTKYSVGAPECPHCGSVIRVNENTRNPEEGAEDMAKITVHGGPSNAAADEVEGGEDSSPGTSSSTSSEKEPSSPEQSEKPGRSRARGTGSRSNRGQTEPDGTAETTATDGPKTAGSDTK